MSNEAPITIFQEDINAEVSSVVQDKLDKANITEMSLAQLADELADLAKLDPNKNGNKQLIQGGITKAKSTRNNIVRICKKGREFHIQSQKAWIQQERELVAVVEAAEKPLQDIKDRWVAEEERIEREELERQETAIRARLVAIERFGFSRRTGSIDKSADYYTNGITTIEMSAITMSDEEVWGNVLKGIEIAWNEEQERKAKEAEAAAHEAERIRLAQEDIERKQRELKEQQDAFNAKINEARKNELLALGCEIWVSDEGDGSYDVELVGVKTTGVQRFAIFSDQLAGFTDAEWLYEKEVAANAVSIREKDKADAARRKKVEEDRIAAEAVERERQRAALQAKLDEEARIENEKRAQEAEAQRIAAMGDVEHLDRFYDALSKLGVEMYNQPLTSEIAKHGVKMALPHLDHAMSVINGVLEDLRK